MDEGAVFGYRPLYDTSLSTINYELRISFVLYDYDHEQDLYRVQYAPTDSARGTNRRVWRDEFVQYMRLSEHVNDTYFLPGSMAHGRGLFSAVLSASVGMV